MTDEEKWEIWRNNNAEIQKPYGGSVHKHIVWYKGVDRRKAFLDGLSAGRKELEKENKEILEDNDILNKWIDELKQQIEKLKNNYKKQRNRRIDELQKVNAELKKDKEWLDNTNNEQTKVILELQTQIEKMKPYCKCLCKNYSKFSAMGNDCVNGVCRNCNKWELAK